MAVKFLFLLMFVSFVQILKCSATDSDPMQQKFTSKCDDLCTEPKQNETEVCRAIYSNNNNNNAGIPFDSN